LRKNLFAFHGTGNFTRFIFLFIGIVLTFFIFRKRFIDDRGQGWRLTVESDGRGYYAHLPAVFIYHDLSYDFIEKCEADVIGIGAARKLYYANGQPGNKYFVGVAVLILPFFLLAYAVSYFFGPDLSGYNIVFQGAVAFAALIYLLMGLWFLRKLLLLYKIPDKWNNVLLLLLVFGSNIFYYVVYEPSMSHIYSFAVVAGFAYFLKNFQLMGRNANLVAAAGMLALIILIRPVNALVILFVPFLSGSGTGFVKLIRDLIVNRKGILTAAFFFFAVVFLQPLLYYFTSGSFFHWPYFGEGFDFAHPQFRYALIGYEKGLFLYTPLIFISFLFIIPYFRRSPFAAAAFLLAFLLLTFVISSWSTMSYGGSFSMRPYLEYYPLLILPLGWALGEISSRTGVVIISGLLVLTAAFTLLETYQFIHHLIHYGGMTKEKYWRVFLKTDKRLRVVAYPPKVETMDHDSVVLQKTILNNFELPGENENPDMYTHDRHFSGSSCIRIDRRHEFSPTFQSAYKQFSGDSLCYVEISLMAMRTDDDNDAALVVSLEWPSGQVYQYDSYPVGLLLDEKNTWQKINYSSIVSRMGENDVMKIYVWNNSESPLFVDDLKIELYSKKNSASK
jgi:hypothetical protein